MGGIFFMVVVKGCLKFEVFYVSSNDFEREGVEVVVYVIVEMKNFKVLIIGDNIFGDYGFM